MGIPVSKSRAIEVDGQQFRWMARKGRVKYRLGQRAVSRVLTVQEAKERPGAVLQLTLWPRQWSDWDESMNEDSQPDDGASIVPTDIVQVIQEALVRGWEPSKRKVAFKDKITVSLTGWSTLPPQTARTRPCTSSPARRRLDP